MTTKSPYAHIYQWLADCEQIQRRYQAPEKWLHISTEMVLCHISTGVPPDRFRLAPKTLTVNGVTFPEPMREAPQVGSVCWVIDLATSLTYTRISWEGGKTEHNWLSRGLCHSTKEAAELHAKALLSFTEVAN